MYAAIRRYKIARGSVDKLTQEVQKTFVPIVSKVPGFKEYFWVNAGDDVMFSVSVYQDRAGAEESVRRAADFVQERVASLLPNPPDVTTGEVVVHHAEAGKARTA
jgi:antibiotic biosynthesis monooxygenase